MQSKLDRAGEDIYRAEIVVPVAIAGLYVWLLSNGEGAPPWLYFVPPILALLGGARYLARYLYVRAAETYIRKLEAELRSRGRPQGWEHFYRAEAKVWWYPLIRLAFWVLLLIGTAFIASAKMWWPHLLGPAGPAAGIRSGNGSIIVLAVQTGPGVSEGPIQGQAPCEGDLGRMIPPCLADDVELARAVLSCGPVEATIDRGASHRLFVHFRARLSERFPGMPADIDIVRCVRSRVGFAFSAGVAKDDSGILDATPAPFEILHSKRRPRHEGEERP
jgi:hypothetical protein